MKHLSSDELLERPVALNDVKIRSNNLSCVHKLLVGECGVFVGGRSPPWGTADSGPLNLLNGPNKRCEEHEDFGGVAPLCGNPIHHESKDPSPPKACSQGAGHLAARRPSSLCSM